MASKFSSDDEHPVARALLVGLQVLAMALCACILAGMAVTDAFRIPTHACVDAGPPAAPETPSP